MSLKKYQGSELQVTLPTASGCPKTGPADTRDSESIHGFVGGGGIPRATFGGGQFLTSS